MTDPPAHPWFAAIYDPVTWLAERTLLRPHRIYLAEDLEGRVLDLGAGTGAMLPYFDTYAKDAVRVQALEPDPYMRRRGRRRADSLRLDVTFQNGRAEDLPYSDGYFDAVVASMVFCTIPVPERALREIERVLQPEGEFRFLEHVADGGWRGSVQKSVAPLWRRVAGGCHLHRRTGRLFASSDHLDVVEMQRRTIGVTPVRPFIRGRMIRRSSPVVQ